MDLQSLMNKRWPLPTLLAAGLILSFIVPMFGLVDQYVQLIIMYVGISTSS